MMIINIFRNRKRTRGRSESHFIPGQWEWYDHMGIHKETRDKYYEKMKTIAKEYGASVWDLSDKEYEPYYMHDGIHPGWRSWIETNKMLYEYFLK